MLDIGHKLGDVHQVFCLSQNMPFLKDFQLLRWYTLEVLEKQPNHCIYLSDVQLPLQCFRSNFKYLVSVSLAMHSLLHSINLLLQCSSNPGSILKAQAEHLLHLYYLWFSDNLQNFSCLSLHFLNFPILTLWFFFLFGCFLSAHTRTDHSSSCVSFIRFTQESGHVAGSWFYKEIFSSESTCF